MSLSRSISTLANAVLVKAAANMDPDALANAMRFAATSEVHATAMTPAIFDALSGANDGAVVKPVATRKATSTPAKVEAPAAVSKAPRGARKAAASKPASDAGEKSGKRPRSGADVIAQRADLVEAYVLANPGCKAGAIAAHVGCKAPQLANIFKALDKAGKISVTGTKSLTRYHGPVSDDAADGRNDIDEDEDQAEAAE